MESDHHTPSTRKEKKYLKNVRKALGIVGRVALQSMPYVGVALMASVAHPAMAAVGGAGALPGIAAGAPALQGSLQFGGGALAIGGLAWSATHFVRRHDDWVGGLSGLGAGAVGAYGATQAPAIAGVFGAGAIF